MNKRHIICIDCGAKRYFKHAAAGHSTTRCVDCQKTYHIMSMRNWRGNNPNSRNKYDTKVDQDKRAHCVSRNKCLTKYSYYNNMPCKGCKQYVRKVFDVAEYMTNPNYSVRTRLGNIVYV